MQAGGILTIILSSVCRQRQIQFTLRSYLNCHYRVIPTPSSHRLVEGILNRCRKYEETVIKDRALFLFGLRGSSRSRMGVDSKTSTSVELVEDAEFEVILRGKANNVHEVTKYRSKSTGLEVVHAAIEGPIVNGYIVLATKADDDDGLPHTLEHLIFLGSEEYPYKGVLDILANKCYASGTNAWTDVDHTCYTMTTAGSHGFCRLLPIYMDHIFYPILSESAFKTEVYHVTGEGTDGGVVYSEIQAHENTAEDKSCTELTKTIYPPTSGYHYQTGGVCKNVRESCNNDKVKEFHKKFYNSRNTCLIVCGMVDPKDIFTALEPTIKKLNERGVVDKWSKPWLEDVPEIAAPVQKTFKFPSDEEDECLITVGFRGPSAVFEMEDVAAMRLLFEYLTDSSVGAFQLEFVENDDPLCSGVAYSEMENSRTTFYFEYEAVPQENVKKIVPTMEKTLKQQVKNFDISRMKDIIQKNFQEELSSMENTPHNSIAYAVIGDYLYGSDDNAVFNKRINSASTIKSFMNKPKEFWSELIQKRILNQKWITLVAQPSKEAYKAFAREEESRIQELVARLGEPGLQKLTYELEEAVKINSKPAPATILDSVTVPCTDSIHFHSIQRHQNPEWASDVKCNLYVDDIKSNFVYVSVMMDTSSLSLQQRKHLALLRELIVESPVSKDDGTIMSFEEVVAELSRTWLSYGCSIGVDGGGRFKCGSFSHTFLLTNQMELNKIEEGFDWIRKLLWNTQWTSERMKVIAKKMAGDVSQLKRKGTRMTSTVLKDVLYKTDSNVKATSLIRQHKFLKDLAASLPRGEKKLKEMFESIRKVITSPENMTIHIAASLGKLETKAAELPTKTVGGLLAKTFQFPEQIECEKRIANQKDTVWMKDGKVFKSKPEQIILGLGSEDTAYVTMVAPGPTEYLDAEIAVLNTAMQYFCQTEGPFYQVIRGGGFAYDFYMDTRCSEGLVYFNLNRCTDIVGAYKAAKDIVVAHLDGSVEFTEEYLSSAKSSLIFEYIEGEKTPLALASTSLFSYYRNVPQGYTRDMIAKISSVQLSQLKPIVEKYFKPIFFEEYVCSVVCQSDKVSAVTEGFAKLNKKLTIIPGLANSFLEKWD